LLKRKEAYGYQKGEKVNKETIKFIGETRKKKKEETGKSRGSGQKTEKTQNQRKDEHKK